MKLQITARFYAISRLDFDYNSVSEWAWHGLTQKGTTAFIESETIAITIKREEMWMG